MYGVLMMFYSQLFRHALAFTVFSCLVVSTLHAQSNTGTILGTVQDETGAFIPDASVTVRNLGTSQERTVKSDGSGSFNVSNLQVGHYSITISHEGFTKAQIADTELQVAQRATINPVLHVGTMSERVEVIATQVPLLNEASSSVGQVIDTKTVQNVPLNGRSFWQLTQLTPGVSFIQGGQNIPAGGTSIRASAVNVNVNGLSPSWTGWYLDGSNITESQLGGTLISPNVDALQEFKVESSNMPADYGHSPTIVNATLKSGTNAFHGTAYEFLRNNAFDAKNYFYVPPSGSTRRNQPLHRNQFGFAVGGPIVRSHTFFFIDMQSTLYRLGQNFDNIVPSAAMRTGDYRGSGITVKDPLTGLPFANNVIPANRVSPQAAYFLKYLPDANQLRGTVSHAVLTNGLKQQLDQGDLRVDQSIFAKDHLMGRYSINNNHETDPNAFPALGGFPLRSRGQNMVLRETHIFSPKWLSETQFSYYRSVFFFTSSIQGQDIDTAAGIKGFEGLSPPQYAGLPQLNISNYTGFTGQSGNYPKQNKIRSWQYVERATFASGRHEVRFGYENFHDTNTYFYGSNSVGTFTFNNAYSGDNFADFLLGYPGSSQRSYFRSLWGNYVNFQAMYVQDDFKARPKLTINAGLRWEINPFYNGIKGQTSGLNPANGKVVVPDDFSMNAQPGTPTLVALFSDRLQTTSSLGLPISVRPAARKNVGPRLGIAYGIGQNTVIRGAYGIFFLFPDNNAINNTQNVVPFVASQTLNNTKPTPTLSFGDFYSGQPIVAANTSGAACSFGFIANSCSQPSLTTMELRAENSYVQEYNVAMQHQFGNKLSLDVAYVGNRTLHIVQPFQVNDPFPGAGTIQTRRPLPQWGTIGLSRYAGNANYNALQAKLETRALAGATFLVSYTYGRCLTDGTFNGLTREQSGGYRYYGVCNYDINHNLVTSGVYDLPFGRGKQFLGNSSGFMQGLIGNWGLSGVGTLQSGLPFTLTISSDQANTGLSSQRPNITGKPQMVRRPNCWYYNSRNASCPTGGTNVFTVPQQYTYGNGGTNTMRNDGLVQFDISVLKQFHFTETRSLEFRGAFFNVFNHTTFATPVTNIDSNSAGQITSTLNAARSVELAGKIYF
jgi:hypothetical protein